MLPALFALSAATFAAQPASPLWDELLEVWTTTHPRSGTWLAIIDGPTGPGSGRWQVSYDWASTSWAIATGHGVMGNNGSGGALSIIGSPAGAPVTLHSEITRNTRPSLPGHEEALDQYFPTLIARELAERPESVVHVERVDPDITRVHVAWPNASRNQGRISRALSTPVLRTVLLDFDPQGRLVRRQQGADREMFIWTFEYDERSPRDFPVPSVVRHGFAHAEPRARVLVSLDRVSPERAEQLLSPVELRAAAAQIARATTEAQAITTSAQLARRTAADASPAAPADDPRQHARDSRSPPPPGPFDKYRWPLILTGIITIAIGAVAWWRRARA